MHPKNGKPPVGAGGVPVVDQQGAIKPEHKTPQPKPQAPPRKPRRVVRALADLRLLLDGGQR
jgi:hypothetical protein